MIRNLLKKKFFPDYDYLNPPIVGVVQDENGNEYEEIISDATWLNMGYCRRPDSRWRWFVYHVCHGLIMGYPALSVLWYAIRNTNP